VTYYVISPLLPKSSRVMNLRHFKNDKTDCIRKHKHRHTCKKIEISRNKKEREELS